MQVNPVVWFEIYVDDMERAKKFYESVLDTTLEKMQGTGPEMYIFGHQGEQGSQQSYGTGGALVKMPGFGAGKNSVLVYFGCEDCAVEEARAAKFGGHIEKGKFSIGPHGFISLVYDTEGNMVGLHSMK